MKDVRPAGEGEAPALSSLCHRAARPYAFVTLVRALLSFRRYAFEVREGML